MHNEKFGSKNEFFGTLLTSNDIDDDIKNRLMRMLLKEEGEIKSIEELVKAKIKSKHKDEKQILASNLLTSILNNDFEDVESILDDYDSIDNLQDGQSICLFYRDKFPQGYNLLNEILEHIATCNKMQYNVCKEKLCNKNNLLNIIKALQAVSDTEEYMEDPCGVDHICDIPVVDGLPIGAYALGGNWFKSIGNKIRNSFDNTKEKIEDFANETKEKLRTFGNETRQNVKDFSSNAKEKLQDIGGIIAGKFNNIGNNIKSGLAQTKNKVKSGIDEAKDKASDFFNNVKNGIAEWKTTLQPTNKEDDSILKTLGRGATKVYEDIREAINQPSPLKDFANDLKEKVTDKVNYIDKRFEKIADEVHNNPDGSIMSKVLNKTGELYDRVNEKTKELSRKLSEEIREKATEYADSHEKGKFLTNLAEDISNYDKNNDNPDKVRDAHYIQGYKGDNVIKEKLGPTFAIGDMIFYDLSNDDEDVDERQKTLDHEYGHNRQYDNMGIKRYLLDVAFPSMNGVLKDARGELVDRDGNSMNYYTDQPWENGANKLGGVKPKLDNNGNIVDGDGNIGYDKTKAVVGDKQDILNLRYRKKKLLQWLDSLN
ncbi:MAG: hypothetical protein ACI4M5_04310 [Christensenellales bacterium]